MREIAISVNMEQATAEANQIKSLFEKLDALEETSSKTMLQMCPIIAHLQNSNGWLYLDNYSSVDGKHDSKTFGKWFEKYFNKPHSTTSETISVTKRFFNTDGTIKEGFDGFGYTQLLRMKSLSDEEIKELNITPEKTSADIKKLVVEKRKAKTGNDGEKTEATNNEKVSRETIPDTIKALLTDVEVPEDVTQSAGTAVYTLEEVESTNMTLQDLVLELQKKGHDALKIVF